MKFVITAKTERDKKKRIYLTDERYKIALKAKRFRNQFHCDNHESKYTNKIQTQINKAYQSRKCVHIGMLSKMLFSERWLQ